MSDNQIQVHLPDGSIKQLPAGSTAHDVAMSISPRLAAAAIVARVKPVHATAPANRRGPTPGDEKSEPGEQAMYAPPDASAERLVDLRAPLTEDVHLQLLTEKDPDALQVVRHSAAHVMATAVLELFPETRLGHGPATDAGFFYDFYRPTPFTDRRSLRHRSSRWPKSSGAMSTLSASTSRASRASPTTAPQGDFMKVHFIERFTKPGDEISLYRNGKFVDFCRGPHVPSTGRVKAFKVMSLSGAYWLGDEKNPQLQRIYGTAFFSKKDLDEYLALLEEAKRRDHGGSAKSSSCSPTMKMSAPACRSGCPRARPSAASWRNTFSSSSAKMATSTSTRRHWPRSICICAPATGSITTKTCSRPWT